MFGKLKISATFALAALPLAACTTMDGATASNDMARPAATVAPPVMVGGAAMYPARNIIENAVNSPIHRTLVQAVQAAGLVETLSGPGPFTVFAPTDEAFGRVPEAARTALMQPAMRPALTKVLTHHVVAGRITAADLVARIRAGNGRAMVTTVAGEALTFTMMGDRVMISGANGSMAHVTQADVLQSNGVIHVVDGVLLPTL